MIKAFKKGVPTRLFQNFKSTEFDCHCKNIECQTTYIDVDHVFKLQKKRDKLRKAITIHSGFRCLSRNVAIYKSMGRYKKQLPPFDYSKVVDKAGIVLRQFEKELDGYHPIGVATDISVFGLTVPQMAKEFDDFDGLGTYKGKRIIHVDSRGYHARWKE